MTTTHPRRRPDVEKWLTDLGATFTFHPDLPLARINQAASLANQVRHEPLHPETVERYAAAMNQGAIFPAILIEPHGAILCGVHRWAAAQQAGHTTIAAYTVTATDAVLLRIRVEDNARHGLATTNAERIDHAIALMGTGMSQREAAAIVQIPQPKLSIAVAAVEATRRARDLGVDDRFARLPQPVRYQLSQLDHDDVFTAAAEMVARHAVPARVVTEIVRGVRSADPHEALRVIGAEAADWQAREDGKVRDRGRTARATLDSALAAIVSLDPQAVYDACPNDDVRAVLAQRIMDAAGKLAPTLDLLKGSIARGRAA